MKKFLCPALLLIAVIIMAMLPAAMAEDYNSEGFIYHIEDDCAVITGYTGDDTDVVVPEHLDDWYVSRIEASCFSGNTDITSVSLPNNFEWLPEGCFAGCASLSSVDFPDNLQEIPNDCFNGCTAIDHIDVPDSAWRIGERAFANMTTDDHEFSIYIRHTDDIAHNLFEGCDPAKVHVITDHYTRIEEIINDYNNNAWENDEPAFNFSYATMSGTGDGVENGPKFVFAPVSNITAILHGVERDENYTGEIVIPESIDGYEIIEIWEHAFQGDTSLVSVDIPDTVRHIGYAAFADCKALESVVLPDQLWEIQDHTFAWCESLSTINIPDTVEWIGARAFQNTPALTDIEIGKGVTSIHEQAFMGSGLTSLVLPENVNRVDSEAFAGCENLETAELSPRMGEITDRMFAGSGLKEIAITDNFYRVGHRAFENCANLETVYLSCHAAGDTDWEAFGVMTDEEGEPIENEHGDIFTNVPRFLVDRNTEAMDFVENHGWEYEIYTVTTKDGWIYSPYYDNTASLMGHADKASLEGDVVLPSVVDGRKVRIIASPDEHAGTDAFSGCENVTSFTIPATVEFVGSSFFNCPKLESVYMADSVVEIGEYCFDNCPSLKEVRLSYNLEYLPPYAFANCTSLETIHIDDGTHRIEDHAFFNCASLREVILELGVEYIGDYAFEGCSSLEEIDIPNGVYEIREGAFYNCENLKRVKLSKNLEYIPHSLFADCVSLSDIRIPASVRGIGDYAFSNCASLEMLEVSSTVENLDGSNIFIGCSNLVLLVEYGSPIEKWAHENFASYILKEDGVSSGLRYTVLSEREGNFVEITGYDADALDLPANGLLYIPDVLSIDGVDYTVDGVGAYAFANRSENHPEIKAVSLPESARYISVQAFMGNESLKKVTLRGDNQMIAVLEAAFAGCSSLSEINLPDSVIAIHNAAFSGAALKNFTAPASLENLGNGALEHIQTLTKVDLSPAENLYEIGLHAFGSCENLSEVILPENLEVLNRNAFAGCYGLKSIDLPESLHTIGTKTFYLTGLESIYIPDNATNIGPFAFCASKSLTSARLPENIRSLPNNMFDSCEALESIVIPESVETIGHAAFYDCLKLSSVDIPSSVTFIGDQCFGNCESLTNLYIPASVSTIADSAFHSYHFTEETNSDGEPIDVQHDDGLMGTISLIVDAGSYAEAYAVRNGIPYTLSDSSVLTPAGDFSYETDGDGVVITGYNGDAEFVIVPVRIDGKPVLAIGENAFAGNTTVKRVVLLEGLNSIAANAFAGCSAMTDISIPETVDSIDETAFDGCRDDLTFHVVSGSCAHLFAMENEAAFQVYANKVSDFDFFIDEWSLSAIITGYHGDARHVMIPETIDGCPVRYIENTAFCYYDENGERIPNDDLLSVKLPEGLLVIGDEAFAGCCMLQEINFPDSLEVIGSGAFRNNFELKSVEFGENLREINGDAFRNCTALTEVYIPHNVDRIEWAVFAECSNLETVELSDDLDYIAAEAFAGCFNLRNIGLTDEDDNFNGNVMPFVGEVHDVAFADCESLEGIDFSAGLYHLGQEAFAFCRNLHTVVLPQAEYNEEGDLIGIDTIHDRTFLECNSLENITLPETVEHIGEHAFAVCESLSSINIPESVSIIGDGAFTCTGLTSVELPGLMEYVGNYAFEGCEQLTSVVLPRNLETIRDSQFYGCFELKEIELPDSLLQIETHAFAYCGFESINIPSGVNDICDHAFYSCENLTELTIEEGISARYDEENDEWFGRHIGEFAFMETGLQSLVIPEGFIGLGDGAFFGCYDLEQIYLPASLQWIGDGAFSFHEDYQPENRLFHVIKNTPAFWWCEEHGVNFVCASHSDDQDGYSLFYTVYDMDGETVAAITGYEGGLPDNLVIPASISTDDGDIPVYSITRHAFDGAEIVTLSYEGAEDDEPSSPLKEIEEYAFANCLNLTSVTLPEQMNWLGNSAFENCVSLQGISLPHLHEDNAFLAESLLTGCTSLQYVNIPNGIREIDHNVFNGCALESIEIPESVWRIGEDAFSNNPLNSVYISGYTTDIADSAFNGIDYEQLTMYGDFEASAEWYCNDRGINYVYRCDAVDGVNYVFRVEFDEEGNSHQVAFAMGFAEDGFKKDVTVKGKLYGDIPVLAILDGAFEEPGYDEEETGVRRISSVTIEEGVLYIYDNAFVNCVNLENITIPASMRGIYSGAFDNCAALKSVDLSACADLTELGSCVFQNCAGIESIKLSDSIEYIGGNTFNNCDSLTEITLPASLRNWEDGTFAYCDNLKKVALPEGLEYIGPWTFEDCRNLTEINIPASLRRIEDGAFRNCSGLTFLDFTAAARGEGNSFEWIDGNAFEGCENLIILVDYGSYEEQWASENFWGHYILSSDVSDELFTYAIVNGDDGKRAELTGIVEGKVPVDANIPGSIKYNGKTYKVCGIGGYAFAGADQLRSVTLPATTLYIGPSAFRDCKDLQNVTISTRKDGSCDLFAISEFAFAGCQSLTAVNLPDTLEQIAPAAFAGTALTEWKQPANTHYVSPSMLEGSCVSKLTLHENVRGIDEYAFAGCPLTEGVIIPASVEYIGNGAFDGAFHYDESNPDAVPSITFEEGNLGSIGDAAFRNSGLHSVTLPASVGHMGAYAFQNNGYLRTADLSGAGFNYIPAYAFQGCGGLTEIKLPMAHEDGESWINVREIGAHAFHDCHNLTGIELPGDMDRIGAYAFANSGVEEFTVPNGVTALDYTFMDCSNLRRLTAPDTVVRYRDALAGCDLNNMTLAVHPNSYMLEIANWLKSENEGLTIEIIGEFAPESIFEINDEGYICGVNLDVFTDEEIHLVIPETINGISVTGLAQDLFNGTENLVSVSLPNSLRDISSRAFKNCPGLAWITIPNALESVGEEAFRDCINLAWIRLPQRISHIGDGAFAGAGCGYDENADPTAIVLEVVSGSYAYYYGIENELDIHVLANNAEDFHYEIMDGNSVIIHGYNYDNGLRGDVIIPEYIEGYPVVEISDYAFHDSGEITSVYIPDTVYHIGEGAFQSCYDLAYVRLPENDGFNDIYYALFRGCPNLRDIYIPGNVRNIHQEAFTRCYNLGSVAFGGNSLDYIAHDVFWGCNSLHDIGILDDDDNIMEGNILPHGFNSLENGVFEECYSLEQITIPDSVGYIGMRAFGNCYSLREIEIPASVNCIDNWAFQDCGNLSKISFETGYDAENDAVYGLEYLNDEAFDNCYSLQSITLPETMIGIGSYSFRNCHSLETVEMPESGMDHFGDGVFENCHSLQSIAIPEGIAYINHAMFVNCGSLQTVQLPSTLEAIGSQAFENCHNLRSINLEEMQKLEVIENNAFSNCGSLRSITLPDCLKVINDGAFENCHQLKNLTFPAEMEYLGNWAFSSCHALSGVITLPDGIEEIGESTFSECTDLAGVILGKDVKRINNWAFLNCLSLGTLELNDGLEVISDWAFCECYGLDGKRIEIPASLQHVGEGAFAGVEGGMIWIVERNSTAEYIAQELGIRYEYAGGVSETNFTYVKMRDPEVNNGETFIQITGVTEEPTGKLTIPAEIEGYPVKIIDYDAFYGYAGITSVSLPDGLLNIRNGAFSGCFNLAEINLPDSLVAIGNGAFEGCTSLAEIDLPDGLVRLGGNAFSNCDSLQSVSIPKDLQIFEEGVFSYCDKLESAELPDGLTTLGNYAFIYSGLKEITIPASLNLAINTDQPGEYPVDEGVGFCAFGRCTKLESITLADGVTTIADWMFEDCISLTEITIPGSVTSIGFGAFENSTGIPARLETVMLPDNITYIAGDVFEGNDASILANYKSTTLTTLDEAGYAVKPVLPESLLEQLSWTGETYYYQDGNVHGVSLNIPAELSSNGFSVAYENASAAKSGKYTASAVLTYKDRELNHHPIETIEWSIEEAVSLKPIENKVYDGIMDINVDFTVANGLDASNVSLSYYQLDEDNPYAAPVALSELTANAGLYKVAASISFGNPAFTAVSEQDFAIERRETTVAADNVNFAYDGKAHTVASFSADNLADGHVISGAAIAEEPQTELGVYSLTPVSAVIADAEGNDVTANYSITFVPGTMKISNLPQTFKLSAGRVNAFKGEKFQLFPIVEPESASYEISFVSSNKNNASVDNNGLVKIKEAKNATITATITFEGGSLSASCIIAANTSLPVTTMPSAITFISEEAFEDSSIAAIDLSKNEGMSIGANAFRNCKSLQRVVLPENISFDANGVFTSTAEDFSSEAVLFCRNEQQVAYAVANSLDYVLLAD